MDYRLPNGTVIRNVPDDMPKHAIQMRAVRERLATNKDFGYDTAPSAAGDTKLDRFVEGMGRGSVETFRQIGNIFGVISDDEIADAQKLDQDLMATGMGQFGSIVGEIATTLPVSGGIGAAGRAAGRGLAAAQKAGNISRKARVGLGRGLQSRAGRGAVEGAAYGGIFGGPDNRAEGAAMGAAFGGVLAKGSEKLGQAWRNFKIANQSPEAVALQKETGQFIPLSQSGEGMAKMFYNGILANLPGVSRKVRGQYDDAVNDLRHWAATKAHPDTDWARINLHADDSMPTMLSKLDDFWWGNADKGIKGAYDDIGRLSMDAGNLKVPVLLKDMIERSSKGTFAIPQGATKGANLLNFRNHLHDMKGQFTGKDQQGIRNMIDKTLNRVDDTIKRNTDDVTYAQYEHLAPAYRNMKIFESAFKKAGGSGEFTPVQMLKAAAQKEGRGGGGVAPQSSFLAVARDAAKALPPFPSESGIYQILAATQAGGALAATMSFGLVSGGAGLAAVIGVGRWMASKRFQQVITGQHNMKRLLDPKYHPWFVRSLKTAGLTTRQIAGIEAGIIASGEK